MAWIVETGPDPDENLWDGFVASVILWRIKAALALKAASGDQDEAARLLFSWAEDDDDLSFAIETAMDMAEGADRFEREGNLAKAHLIRWQIGMLELEKLQ